jgi:hypothetical protein
MGHTIRRVEYFYTSVNDRPGEALRFLTALADLGVNLLAFTAIPTGMHQTQLMIFPADSHTLTDQSERVGFAVDGPHSALLVQGEDVPGALVGIHESLHDAGINVAAATGVSGGGGSFGYVIHIRPADFERAAEVLGV